MCASEKAAKAADKVVQSMWRAADPAPDPVNWPLNIRGDDLRHTLHLCFALLEQGEVTLLVPKAALKSAGYEGAGGYHCLDVRAWVRRAAIKCRKSPLISKPSGGSGRDAGGRGCPTLAADLLQAMKARKWAKFKARAP